MCGRFVRVTPTDTIAQEYPVEEIRSIPEPSFNITPGQDITVLLQHKKNLLVSLKWGLIPSWSKDPKIGYKLTNARSETIQEKPSFKEAFNKRRCLIIADGFYEWKEETTGKQPYYIHMKNNHPFAMAGIWESWKSLDGNLINSCSIITTSANDLMRKIHERMPVIISHENVLDWLDVSNQNINFLKSLLHPYNPDEMIAYKVSKSVNSSKYNAPDCIQEIG